MLKKICSLLLAVCMVMSIGICAGAEYTYVDSFKENNMSAKKIVISNEYAFVAGGSDSTFTDVINIYNLKTKELMASLSLPVYETSRNYFVENMYADGEYLYVSWNRSKGWGDPVFGKYEIKTMLEGNLKKIKSIGIRGEHVSCRYDNKLFYTEPRLKNVSIINKDTMESKAVMSLGEFETSYLEKAVLGIKADADYFYIYTAEEIRAYKTDNIYNGYMENYNDAVAVYKSGEAISDVVLSGGNLYVLAENGIDIIKVGEAGFETKGEYKSAGKIMALEPLENKLYAYSDSLKAILVLDSADLSNITVSEQIAVSDSSTEGIKDIALDGTRIYAADLTKGFSLYSASEIDNLETKEEEKAQSYAEELEKSSHAKAIELVVGLRIMDLRSDGLFDPKGYITRGEFSYSVAKIFGEKALSNQTLASFSDVPQDSEYAKSIYGLANLRILNGYGDGTFKPENPVLYEHAVLIMIKALGYYPLVENSNRTCLDIASELGILENVRPDANGYISRENVARLISNSLETEVLRYVSGIDPFHYSSYKDDILLHEMGIRKAKGKVTATEYTSLVGAYTASKGKVEINEIQYPEGSSGAGSFLGRNVIFYYESDEETEHGEIIYVVPDKNEEIIIVEADDISPQTTENMFCYYDEERELKKHDIKNASVILNGVYDLALDVNDIMPTVGNVTLIDADNDGETDVLLVKSYETYIVDAYANGLFRLKYGSGEIDINELDRNGGKVSVIVDGYRHEGIEGIEGIKKFTVLSVLQSRNNEITEIYATNKAAIGLITNMVKNEKVTIEGTEYEVSKHYLEYAANSANNIASYSAGDEVYAYLDIYGRIATTEKNENAFRYGYLVSCSRGDGLNTDKASFKIFADDENELHGSMQKFESAEILKVNGIKTEDIYEVEELFGESGLKKQLIRFTLSLDGKIKSITTAKDKVNKELSEGVPNPDYVYNYSGITENEFTYDAKIGTSVAYRGGDRNTFEGEPFEPVLSTEIFAVPTYDDAKDSEYKIYDHTTVFKSGTYAPGPVEVYDVAPNYEMGACVIKLGSAGSIDAVDESGKFIIVDSFMKGLNEDGEEVTILLSSKDSSGNQTSITIEDEEMADPKGTLNSAYKGVKLLDLPKGSVVQYVTNARGVMAAMRILYMPTETKTYYEYGTVSGPTEGYLSTVFYSAFGKVVLMNGDRVIYNARGKIDEDGDGTVDRQWDGNLQTRNARWDRNVNTKKDKIYLYDKGTGKTTKITYKDMLPDDEIFIVQKGVTTEIIVVYR